MHEVRTGLDRLTDQGFRPLRNQRVGLICNPTTVDRNLRHAVDAVAGAPDVALAAIFGPEHGVWGAAQDMEGIRSGRDPRTGVPVHSLYGSTLDSLKPRPEHLEGIDRLVFDIQDVGSRYYTYLATMAYCMEAAGEAGVPMLVLDRPNPINGTTMEGPGLDPAYRSFVGRFDVPVRHGMTAGELARLFRKREGIDCELDVVPCAGWNRGAWFDETGLPWVMPSPNMPTLDTATVYPGLCLVEGTEMSEGRGTTRPFEIVGAPWIDPWALADALERESLPGTRFRPLFFQPTFGKFRGRQCGGVQIHVVDRESFLPVRTGVAVLLHGRRQWEETGGEAKNGPFWRSRTYEFEEKFAIDRLAGSPDLRRRVDAGLSLDDCCASWTERVAAFAGEREPFLLYG